MKKKCVICKKVKYSAEFYKDKKTKIGLYSACKLCHNKYSNNWKKKNRRKVNEYQKKKWRERSVASIRERREYMRKYMQRPKYKEYQNVWMKNPKNRLDSNLSKAIRDALKGKKAGQRWEKLVGYTIDNLVKHLEAKFELWMSWENYGKWHIDHIIPKSHFKYEAPEDPDFKKCWALENLQPLEAMENIRKNNKIL